MPSYERVKEGKTVKLEIPDTEHVQRQESDKMYTEKTWNGGKSNYCSPIIVFCSILVTSWKHILFTWIGLLSLFGSFFRRVYMVCDRFESVWHKGPRLLFGINQNLFLRSASLFLSLNYVVIIVNFETFCNGDLTHKWQQIQLI